MSSVPRPGLAAGTYHAPVGKPPCGRFATPASSVPRPGLAAGAFEPPPGGCYRRRVEIRLAQAGDAEAIRQIYNREVSTSTVTFDLVPRTLAEQLQWLEARSGAHAVIVAVDRGEVVGFASLSPFRDRPAYNSTVEDSVYVRHDQRGAGVGRLLLTELVSLAAQHGFHTVIARIVGDHAASIELHRRLGFEEVGLEREVGRKFGKWLDVMVMQRLL